MLPIVSRKHMLRLLDKLATDDLFRGRFERHPKLALIEAGFDPADLASFPAEQLAPGILAAKPVFAAEYARVQNAIIDTHACMVAPGPMLLSRAAAASCVDLPRAA